MNDIKVVAFDCDGVMFDTVESNKAYYNQILAHFNLPAMTSEQFEYTHMHTVDEALEHLFKDSVDLETINAYRRKMNYLPILRQMRMEPDLESVLAQLKPDYKTAIATNRSDTMQWVMDEFGLGEFFDLVVTALDVAHPKPHPDQLFKILNHFNLLPSNMLYIGDSVLDEAAAKAAGVLFVAFNKPKLAADYHISHMRELQDILRS
jgi:HAD superfamily hydrolase (TIGR01549 family)